NADGSLDETFSFDGQVNTDSAGGNELGVGVAIDADGKIIVGGSWGTNRLLLARYQGDVINQAPTIADQTFGVAENSGAGTLVDTVEASDPNAGQTLWFQITSGNESGALAIDSHTGQITVANGAALDFETAPKFTLIVHVTDSGSPAL